MPLFPASLHVQAAVIGGDGVNDYDRMAEWAHDASMATPVRARGKIVGSADRLPSETTQTGRETVTGLTPRRTYGRRAPRSAVGLPLPSYEDLCVEAVLDMDNENGSLPKRIFEWIASNYPVAANFRPSCSQALQRAYRKGKLDKHGRAYKVSDSEMIHIKEFQERQRRSREEAQMPEGEEGEEGEERDAVEGEENEEETELMNSIDGVKSEEHNDKSMAGVGNDDTINEPTVKRERYITVSEVSDGDASILPNAAFASSSLGNSHDHEHNDHDADVDEDMDSREAIDFDQVIGMGIDTSFIPESNVGLESLEATEEDTAAIVAAVTASDMDLAGSGDNGHGMDEIDIDDSHSIMTSVLLTDTHDGLVDAKDMESVVDVEVDEIDEMVDVGTEIDVDGDAAVSARTAPTRHQQHRNQRRRKRSRQESEALEMMSSITDTTRPARRRTSIQTATITTTSNSDDEIISVDYVNGHPVTPSMLNGTTYPSADA
ncbi:hypothetical protein BDF19DRAFT_182364 [Syncephalis fuscata]|nr:hypothetical protein BDF19DRAFT_182364 [Syncephalis fuscata]